MHLHTFAAKLCTMQRTLFASAHASTCTPSMDLRKGTNTKFDYTYTGWKIAYDGQNKKYYYNKQFRRSQYERPKMPEESPPLPPPRRDAPTNEHCKQSPLKWAACSPPSRFGSEQENNYLRMGLQAQRAKLRAMLPCLTGDKKVEVIGELAAVESQLCNYK